MPLVSFVLVENPVLLSFSIRVPPVGMFSVSKVYYRDTSRVDPLMVDRASRPVLERPDGAPSVTAISTLVVS